MKTKTKAERIKMLVKNTNQRGRELSKILTRASEEELANIEDIMWDAALKVSDAYHILLLKNSR